MTQSFVLFIVFVSMGATMGYLLAYRRLRERKTRIALILGLDEDDFIDLMIANGKILENKAIDDPSWFYQDVTRDKFREEVGLD